jgi:hypothetical protein
MLIKGFLKHLYVSRRREVLLFLIAALVLACAFLLGYVTGRETEVIPIIIQKN